jgi:hypothetical protein
VSVGSIQARRAQQQQQSLHKKVLVSAQKRLEVFV